MFQQEKVLKNEIKDRNIAYFKPAFTVWFIQLSTYFSHIVRYASVYHLKKHTYVSVCVCACVCVCVCMYIYIYIYIEREREREGERERKNAYIDQEIQNDCLLYAKYIDSISIIFTASDAKLDNFLTILNMMFCPMKFYSGKSTHSISFLDTLLYIDKNRL